MDLWIFVVLITLLCVTRSLSAEIRICQVDSQSGVESSGTRAELLSISISQFLYEISYDITGCWFSLMSALCVAAAD